MEFLVNASNWFRGSTTAQYVVAAACGLWALKSIFGVVRASRLRSAAVARRAKQDPNIPYLFVGPRLGGMLGGGPGVKVESFLRMHKKSYAVTYGMNHHMSPTERLPFIELNGQAVAESHFILEHLAKTYGIATTYADPKQQAIYVSLRRICEDSIRLHLYRSLQVDNPDVMLDGLRDYAPRVPRFLLNLVFRKMYRQKLIDMLNLHGQGDLTNEQYQAEFVRDLQTLETYLSSHKYVFTDDKPGLADASIFGWLYSIVMWSRKDTLKPAPHWTFVRNSKILKAYVENMVAELFPDAKRMVEFKGEFERFNL